jgi:hypothetical protein
MDKENVKVSKEYFELIKLSKTKGKNSRGSKQTNDKMN